MKIIPSILPLLVLTACSHVKQAQCPTPTLPVTATATPAPAHYQLPNTETFSIQSQSTGNTYDIVVAFPSSYANKKPGQKYPVFYVLDAQWQFPLMYTTAGAVNYDGDMPEAILVGVSWHAEFPELMAQRMQDLMPTHISSEPKSGGAKQFQLFLRQELFPRIEQNYAASQERSVSGGSSSTLFVLYTLLTQPDLFNGYMGTSPPLYWDNYVMNRILDETPQDKITTPKRVYLAWGGLEPGQDSANFAKRLAAKHFNGLQMQTAVVENAGHAGVNAESYNKGLEYIYAKPQIAIAAQQLKKYTSTYQSEKGETLTLALEGNGLVSVLQNGWKIALQAQDNSHFYARGNGESFEFRLNSAGEAREIIVNAHGQQAIFKKHR